MTLPWSPEREEAWNTAWWRDDYSWDGLGRIRLSDPPDGAVSAHRTLQDYWRRDPGTGAELSDAELEASGLLVTSPDGTAWHLAHLPQRGKEGSLLKTAFNGASRRLLRDVVVSRLLAATREAADGGAPALLDGIVAPDVDIGEEVAFLHPIRSRRSKWGFVQMYGQFSEIDLSHANLDGIKFSGSCFPRGLILRELRTLGDIDISSCNIAALDLVRIVARGFLDLSGSHLDGRLEADSAYVHRNLRLYELVATADVDLTYLHVHGNTWLATSAKERAATFDARFVATSAEFGGLQAAGVTFGSAVDFRRCSFTAESSFRDARLPLTLDGSEGAFDLATFEQQADLRGVGMAWLFAFAGTIFKHSVLLDQTRPKDADKQFGKAMRRAGVATNATSFQQLERGATALKGAMEGNRDKMREQRFYKYEIRARARRRDLGVLSRAFTSLYVHASDCGLSVKRPLLVLLGLAALMALVYLEVGLAAAVSRGGVLDTLPGAVEYSLARARPLTLWEKPAVETPLGIALAQPWTGVLVRFAAVLQSVGSAILLFLSALAARRHFQIQ